MRWDLIRDREPRPDLLKLSLCHPYDVVIPKLQRDNEKSFKASLAHTSRNYTQGVNRSRAQDSAWRPHVWLDEPSWPLLPLGWQALMVFLDEMGSLSVHELSKLDLLNFATVIPRPNSNPKGLIWCMPTYMILRFQFEALFTDLVVPINSNCIWKRFFKKN